MNKTTPPKHRTPNWKLVRKSYETTDWFGRPKTILFWQWEAQPLRADRKDNPA